MFAVGMQKKSLVYERTFDYLNIKSQYVTTGKAKDQGVSNIDPRNINLLSYTGRG